VSDCGLRRIYVIIAQISDPHLAIPSGEAASDAPLSDGEAALHEAVVHLDQLPTRPDVVVVTGDCAHHGSVREYRQLREALKGLQVPVYVITGNHDDRSGMLDVFGVQGEQPLDGFVQYVVEEWPVRLIALDTLLPGRDEGRLGEERLAWLEARLAEQPERPTLIVMHHPPFRVGLPVYDEIGLVDAEAFGAIIARHSHVEAIIAGHVHSTMTRRFHGTVALTCGSTRHQLVPDLQRQIGLAAVLAPPACLLHVWRAGVGLLTYVSPIGAHDSVTALHDGRQWLKWL
jgi:Icc protein